VDLELSDEDAACLEAAYRPHAVVGALSKNTLLSETSRKK